MRRPLARPLLALVLGSALVGGLLAPGIATGAVTSLQLVGRVGMASHTFWSAEADARAELSRMTAGGVHWIREDFRWDVLEPTKGVFDWQRSDGVMAAASATGVEVLAILTYSARWASSDPSGQQSIYFPPRNTADYAAFARAVVQRYGAGGSFWAARPDLAERPLAAVELWNEPWGHWFWKSGVDPAAYARLARAAAEAVESAAPTVKVLIAGDLLQVRTDGAIAGWIDRVLAADPGLAALVDAYSVHPYPYPRQLGPLVDRPDARWDFGRIDLIRDILARRGAAKPIWITEIGWSTAATTDSVTEAAQAQFLVDAITRSFTQWADVERVFVYTWTKDRPDPGDREAHYGLRRADGSWKPAWSAIRAMIAATSSAPTTATSTPLPVVTNARLVRVAGVDRIATAVSISQSGFREGGAAGAVLARSDDHPDALAGAPLAVARRGPLLVTAPDDLDDRVLAELRRALPRGSTVTLLGGTSALGPGVERRLAAAGFGVERLAGIDRFATAAIVASAGLGRPSTVLLATGRDFPDALSAGSAAHALDGAVLLTDGTSLPAATRAYLAESMPDRVFAIGAAAATAMPGATPVVGRDRYDTSRRVAGLIGQPTMVGIASGETFADALTGSADVARRGGQLVLTAPDHLPDTTRTHLTRSAAGIADWVVYGGRAAVGEEVVRAIGGP